MEKGEHKIGNSVVTIGADNPFAPKPIGEEVNTVIDNKEVVEQLDADPPVEDKSVDSDVTATTDMTDITQDVLDSLPKEDKVETKEVEAESNTGDSLGDVYSRVAEQMKTDGYLLPDVEVPAVRYAPNSRPIEKYLPLLSLATAKIVVACAISNI